MNKTLITLGFMVLILVGIVGLVLLLVFRPDQAASFGTTLLALLGIGSAGVVTFYGLGKQQTTLETIKTNTNGRLTELTTENTRLTNLLIAAGIPTAPGAHAATVGIPQAGYLVAPAAAAPPL